MSLVVLHVGKFFPPDHGGMEVYLADLVAAQRASGIEAHALVHGRAHADDPDWLTRVPVLGHVAYAPIAPAFRRGLARLIARLEPDVLHLHMPNNSALLALTLAAAQRLPWVVHWHADVVASRLKGGIALAYKAYRPFEQALLERAGRIIVTSQAYLDASEPLSRWREKCSVVPLGLIPERLSTRDSKAEEAVWQPGRFRLLSVGRLVYYKGFETLVRAVARLPEAHLVIVGEGEERAKLEALRRDLFTTEQACRVTFAGPLDDMARNALIATCDLFCLASRERTEAFGVAALEALFFGKPCLVSDLPGSGLPWLATSTGAGEVVPVDDAAAWASSIDRLRANPAALARMGRQAAELSRRRFDLRVHLDAFNDTYSTLGLDLPGLRTPSRASPLIVIPAKNESRTIAEVITALRAGGYQHIVVVDDQSSDATAELARAAGALVLQPMLQMGAWGAVQTGIRFALRQGYRQVVTIDADGQHEPACIPALLEAAQGDDVVIGAFPARGSPARKLAWQYFRVLTGFSVTDLTSGFRCYNLAACKLLAGEEATLLDYQDLGVLLLLRHAGLTVAEVPVAMYPRADGGSRIFASWGRVVRYMLESSLLCIARWHPRHYLRR